MRRAVRPSCCSCSLGPQLKPHHPEEAGWRVSCCDIFSFPVVCWRCCSLSLSCSLPELQSCSREQTKWFLLSQLIGLIAGGLSSASLLNISVSADKSHRIDVINITCRWKCAYLDVLRIDLTASVFLWDPGTVERLECFTEALLEC